jgi:hypothetical protein
MRRNFLLGASFILLNTTSLIHGFVVNSSITPHQPMSAPSSTFARMGYVKTSLNQSKDNDNKGMDKVTKKITQSLMTSLFIMSNVLVMTSGIILPQPAEANESRLIGEIPGSGIFFKDVLNVESFDDPKVKV